MGFHMPASLNLPRGGSNSYFIINTSITPTKPADQVAQFIMFRNPPRMIAMLEFLMSGSVQVSTLPQRKSY